MEHQEQANFQNLNKKELFELLTTGTNTCSYTELHITYKTTTGDFHEPVDEKNAT